MGLEKGRKKDWKKGPKGRKVEKERVGFFNVAIFGTSRKVGHQQTSFGLYSIIQHKSIIQNKSVWHKDFFKSRL